MVQVGDTIADALGNWRFSGKILVTIPDGTRPLNPLPVLEALRSRCSNITDIVIGLGLHREMRSHELKPWNAFSMCQHNPDNVIYTATVDGIRGMVYRGVAKAEACFSVGVAELHQYAGLSGGHKGLAVGCGGRETILALHRRERITQAGVRIGKVEGNPFRAVVDELGRVAGCRWCLNYVPLLQKGFFGEPTAVIQAIAKSIQPWVPVKKPVSGAILRVPSVKGSSFYQASRAASYLALSPAPPLKDGGVLVIEAPMPEGLGTESGFVRALQSAKPPWTTLLTGAAPTGPGAQRAVILALLMQKYSLKLCGVIDPAPFLAVGLDASCQPAQRQDDWLIVDKPFHLLPQLQ